MASKGGKKRQPGQWQAIAKRRQGIPRMVPTSRGLSNVPVIGQVGSAAYRRLVAKRGRPTYDDYKRAA